MADHADHIHVGFRPRFGINRKLGLQAEAVLRPGQWDDLLQRLREIENPVVPTAPSRWSIPTRRARRLQRLRELARRDDRTRRRRLTAQSTARQLLREAREHLGPAVGHRHEVLDAHAELTRQVDAGLHRHDVAGGQLALGGLGNPRPLVHLEAHTVAEPVAEALAVARLLDQRSWPRRRPR